MPLPKFLSQLASVTAVACVAVLLLHLFDRLATNALLSWIAIAFYTSFCLTLYFMAQLAAKAPQKQLFTALTLMTTVGKMGLSVLVVVLYYRVVEPQEPLFVIPFLVVYVIYTIYETYFMMKLSRVNV